MYNSICKWYHIKQCRRIPATILSCLAPLISMLQFILFQNAHTISKQSSYHCTANSTAALQTSGIILEMQCKGARPYTKCCTIHGGVDLVEREGKYASPVMSSYTNFSEQTCAWGRGRWPKTWKTGKFGGDEFRNRMSENCLLFLGRSVKPSRRAEMVWHIVHNMSLPGVRKFPHPLLTTHFWYPSAMSIFNLVNICYVMVMLAINFDRLSRLSIWQVTCMRIHMT